MENTLIDRRYLVLNALAVGGEARVFRARDSVSEKVVALRLAHFPATQRESVPMPAFHSHWVRLIDSGTDTKHGAYQIYELLDGETLGQRITTGPLEREAWRTFVVQSLDTVEALHLADWVHGDLNAENFFLNHSGWKLLELPFLRFDPPEGRSALFGSIHTLAPEQIDGASPDTRSDLYALGCLYYFSASGAYPHPGATSQEIAIHRLRFDPEPLAAKAPAMPQTWSDWVMSLLVRDPQRRPSSLAAARQLLPDAVA